MPVLEIKGIETVYYDRLYILKGLSLEVGEGDVRVILGPNGAGKTTLLRTIMGLIRNQPRKGEIKFLGKRIDGMSTEKISSLGISFVPEDRGIFPELTVEENLRIVSKKEDTDFVFGLFPPLKERVRQFAGMLSGGEQQMLAIARAILKKPKLLLLDEPSLGLSPKLISEVYKTLKEINKNGTTMFIAEQNARASIDIASYGYVLESGRIVFEGKSEELKEHELVKELYLGAGTETSAKGWRLYKRKRRW